MSPGAQYAYGRGPTFAAPAPNFYNGYRSPNDCRPRNTWLGTPLVTSTRNSQGLPDELQISKLALHARGAPLVIQSPPERFQRRNENRRYYDNYDLKHCPDNRRNNTPNQRNRIPNRGNNIDTISVTSDESTTSNNSETALPRIIKPRKRRKKDRKPQQGNERDVTTIHSVDVTVPNYLSAHYEINSVNEVKLDRGNAFKFDRDNVSYGGATVSYGGDTPLTSFKPEKDDQLNDLNTISASVCQCRYCDPAGQIWEAESFGFSELFNEKTTVDFAPTLLEDSMKVVGSSGRSWPKTNTGERDATLRRSWSDPTSHYNPNRLNTQQSSVSYSLFASSDSKKEQSLKSSFSSSSGTSLTALEVTSEIITSPNGHRDLEIKFYSAPTSAISNNSFFTEEQKVTYDVSDRDKKCSEIETNSSE